MQEKIMTGFHLVSPDCCDHVRGPAVDGDVVAGGELVGADDVLDDEEGLLDLGEGGGRVVAEAAHALAGVAVVERVAAVRGGQAEVAAGLHRGHVLWKKNVSYIYSTARSKFIAWIDRG